MQNLSEAELLPFTEVIGASKKDDRGKRDIYCAMNDVTFITRDIKDYDAGEDDEEKVRTKLHAQISVPDRGGRLRLDFCLNSFRQFALSHLGIPWKYLMKCPASLAKDQVNWWKAVHADKDLLIRIRKDKKQCYARAVLNASYGRLDNTALLNIVGHVADEADMKVWRYDVPDHSMHVKCVLPGHVDMGRDGKSDNVHFGFHIGNSETGNRSLTMDIMQFRLVCANGLIALVDGSRLITQKHAGEIDTVKFKDLVHGKVHEALMQQDGLFAKMQATQDEKPLDVFEETRMVWDRFKISPLWRNMVYQLLTEEYTGGTRWDIINSMTQTARELADNPDARAKLEEAAGKYMLLDKPLLVEAS